MSRDALRALLGLQLDAAASRVESDGPLRIRLWSKLVELGVIGGLAPSARRPRPRRDRSVCAAGRDRSRGRAELVVETAAVAVPLLAPWGEPLAALWLERVLAGDARVAVALEGSDRRRRRGDGSVRARRRAAPDRPYRYGHASARSIARRLLRAQFVETAPTRSPAAKGGAAVGGADRGRLARSPAARARRAHADDDLPRPDARAFGRPSARTRP